MMKNNPVLKFTWLLLPVLILLVGKVEAGIDLQKSVFEQEMQKIRFDYTNGYFADDSEKPLTGFIDSNTIRNEDTGYKQKSPAKAFFLSLAIPGLGQYYYGSRTKPFLFLATEALCWGMNVKYNNDGDDITAEFEAFNREHWNQESYEQYLLWAYGASDDDDIDAQEINHHLPDTRTQQYYEMTGKYDQFSWGWGDAVLSGTTLADYSSEDPPPKLPGNIPYSSNRFAYEQRRHDANNKYDVAKKMIIAAMVNHLISAFEAYFMTKKYNDNLPADEMDFSRLKLQTQFKSIYSRYDTPFVKLTLNF